MVQTTVPLALKLKFDLREIFSAGEIDHHRSGQDGKDKTAANKTCELTHDFHLQHEEYRQGQGAGEDT